MEANELVQEMAQLQDKTGLSHREFARRLGLSHSFWLRLRQGRANPGRKFLVAVLRIAPLYEAEVIECLKGM